jgi:hypothetical protein
MYYQYTFVLVRLARLALLSLEPPCALVVEKKKPLSGAAHALIDKMKSVQNLYVGLS